MLDVPAIVDMVLNKTNTGAKKLYWYGIGRGATALHTSITGNPSLEDKIERFIAAAPCIFRATNLPLEFGSNVSTLRLF